MRDASFDDRHPHLRGGPAHDRIGCREMALGLIDVPAFGCKLGERLVVAHLAGEIRGQIRPLLPEHSTEGNVAGRIDTRLARPRDRMITDTKGELGTRMGRIVENA